MKQFGDLFDHFSEVHEYVKCSEAHMYNV